MYFGTKFYSNYFVLRGEASVKYFTLNYDPPCIYFYSFNCFLDYLNEPFNNEFHKISNVASEKIPVYQIKKRQAKKTEKTSHATDEKSSNKETSMKK